MTVDVATETTIHRSLEVVAGYAGDPTNAPDWYANIESVEWQSERRVESGAQATFVARFLGRRLEYTYELVDVVPNERLVMRTANGPFPMETTYTWSGDDPESTRMTLRNRGEPTGFSKLVTPLMSRAVRRANKKDLAKLKAILEQA